MSRGQQGNAGFLSWLGFCRNNYVNMRWLLLKTALVSDDMFDCMLGNFHMYIEHITIENIDASTDASHCRGAISNIQN